MRNKSLLYELIDRVATLQGKVAFSSSEDLKQWPAEEVTALKKHKLLRTTKPASRVVCTECEEECVRPVHTELSPGGESRLFLVCELQNDVNRIDVPIERLEQWQTTGEYFAGLIAEILNIRQATQIQATVARWEVGLFKGKKHSAHVVLTAEDTLTLGFAGHTVALADALSLEDTKFTVDKKMLTRLVDNPISGGGDSESAEQRRERLRKRVHKLKAQGVKAFLQTVAKEENLSITRIKQLIKDDKPCHK